MTLKKSFYEEDAMRNIPEKSNQDESSSEFSDVVNIDETEVRIKKRHHRMRDKDKSNE